MGISAIKAWSRPRSVGMSGFGVGSTITWTTPAKLPTSTSQRSTWSTARLLTPHLVFRYLWVIKRMKVRVVLEVQI